MKQNPRRRGARASAPSMSIFQFGEVVGTFLVVAALLGVLAAGFFLPVVGAAGAAIKAAPASFDDIPSDLELVTPSEESRMLDKNGRVITRFYSSRRIVLASDQIPDVMKDAIIAVEDRRFMDHYGVDPDGLARAALNNFLQKPTQGASTITQQYVKNMLVEQGIQSGDQDLIDDAQEQSTERKLREVRYAMGLEARMTKDEILTGYLNIAPFGPTVYGVEAASRAYFSKSASKLTVSEAALLAGITNSPVEYNPLVYPEAAQERRDFVLEKMLEEDKITQKQYDKAVKRSVEKMLDPDNRSEGCNGARGSMGYFCNYALEEFLSDPAYGEDRGERLHLLETGGLVIRTTIDPALQKDAYDSARETVPINDKSGVNTAIVSVVPETGHIVAMAQNTKFGPTTEENPRNTEVNFNAYEDHGGGTGFQPGSTMKIFTLAQWFAEGKGAYDTVGSNNRDYAEGSLTCKNDPSYYSTYFRFDDLPGKDGAHAVLDVMKLSINQGIASMATKVDYCSIFDIAAAAGVTDGNGDTLDYTTPTQLIGGAQDVAPLTMASAYATFANGGVRCDTMALTEVSDRDGNTIKTYEPNCERTITAKVAGQVSTVMKMVANSYPYQLGRDAAAKSGTTDNNANTWMVGYVPQLATAAWAGYASNSSKPVQDIVINGTYYSEVYGGTFVGPMWVSYMERATEDMTAKSIPDVWIGDKPVPVQPKSTSKKSSSSSSSSSSKSSSKNKSND